MKIKLLQELNSSEVIKAKKIVYFEFEDEKFSGNIDKDIIKLYDLNKKACSKEDEFVFIHNIVIDNVPVKICVLSVPKNEHRAINNAVKNIATFIKSSEDTDVLIDLSNKCLGSESIRKLTESLYISLYKFDNYKLNKKSHVDNIYIVSNLDENIQKAFDEGCALGEATCLAKQMVNEPANVMLPERIAKEAVDAGIKYGFDVTVYEKDEIEKIYMPAYLEVAKASDNEPRLIVMKYMGDASNPDKILGLVGKGLSFDTGGYSLKTPLGMLTMKTDMGGSAAVIGAMSAVAAQKLKVNVITVVASCENMVSGKGYRPGDIINSRGGKTIFVKSTDAEGRLTLIDAVDYIIKEHKVSRVVDIATLTGAQIIALGNSVIGSVSNDDDMWKITQKASELSGEKVWRMPIFEEHIESIKHKEADLVNSAREGGMITAGAFIGEFVGDTPWVHLDIAGPSWTDKPLGLTDYGATGSGVRLLYFIAKNINF